MTFRLVVAIATLSLLSACGQEQQVESTPDVASTPAPAPVDLAAQAMDIAQSSIIIDTHIDVPYRLHDGWEDVSEATEGGDYDYPRAKAGGLNAPFMSIYTPAALEAEGRSKEVAEELIDLVNRIVNESPDKYAIALSPADIEERIFID